MVAWKCPWCDVICDYQIIVVHYNVKETHIQLIVRLNHLFLMYKQILYYLVKCLQLNTTVSSIYLICNRQVNEYLKHFDFFERLLS